MRANTDWFRDARWGVFFHYLAELYSDETNQMDVDRWNRQVDQFDVTAFASQLKAVGASYVIITIGQNSGFFIAPNATYDTLVGRTPSRCSRRDLVADMHTALAPEGIRLLVYLPSGAPGLDPLAVEKLEWDWGFNGLWLDWPKGWPHHDVSRHTGKRLVEFQLKWEAVIREWSLRWGDKIAGWWIDGCYFADEMYRHESPPNFESLAAALKAGNAESIIAFNTGVRLPVISATDHEDFTAGEISTAFPAADRTQPLSRWVDGTQLHVMTFLGEWWGGNTPRFSSDWVAAYTHYINSHEGVMTWDVPISPEGIIPQPFLNQLASIGKPPVDTPSAGK